MSPSFRGVVVLHGVINYLCVVMYIASIAFDFIFGVSESVLSNGNFSAPLILVRERVCACVCMSEPIDSTSMSGCLCDPCAWVGVGGASTQSVFTFWRRPFLNVSNLEVCVCVCVLSSEKSC